jgi:hypothetical protein
VHYAVEWASQLLRRGENIFKRGPVSQLSLDVFHTHRKQVPMAMAKVVKNNGLVPTFRQQTSYGTTYVPRATCYQNLHKKAVPSLLTLV